MRSTNVSVIQLSGLKEFETSFFELFKYFKNYLQNSPSTMISRRRDIKDPLLVLVIMN